MDNYILRQEHEEFVRRIDAENDRQNKRITLLEDSFKQMNALTISVERMAVNMENMLSAIEKQGKLIEKQNDRLESIEKEPARESKQIKMSIITSLLSAVIGAVVVAIIAIL